MNTEKIQYFKDTDTLFAITEKYPQTIEVFAANGFGKMVDEDKRTTLGKTISLKDALKLKNKNIDIFTALLRNSIDGESQSEDVTLRSGKDEDAEIMIVGGLPCPVRIPLLEGLDKFMGEFKEEHGLSVKHDLKAASQGAGWIETYIDKAKGEEDLPEIFISAGFETFFDNKRIGRFINNGSFADRLPFKNTNSDFANIDIMDPKGDYSMIGVVPAVFLVNENVLGDRPMPKTWEDLLDPCFANSISLPVGDFDLFSSILIHIFKEYGEDGVRKLGKGLLESMHPAEMVKSDKKKATPPAITIMPYFFTKMTKLGGPMKAVWPEDGAIISPIFLLSKRNAKKNIQPIIDFLASKEVGEILSHHGLFPSINPSVDNRLEKENKFMWVGWGYIYSHDIPKMIAHCEKIFNGSEQ